MSLCDSSFVLDCILCYVLDGENGHHERNASHSSPSSPVQAEDFVVLGLSYMVTEKEFREYFMQFGELDHAEVYTCVLRACIYEKLNRTPMTACTSLWLKDKFNAYRAF